MTREQILASISTMIEGMEDLFRLSSLQTIAEEANQGFTILQLSEIRLDNGKFRLDYVVNKESTDDRFMVQITADGVAGDFYTTYSEITDIVAVEYNNSEYDL